MPTMHDSYPIRGELPSEEEFAADETRLTVAGLFAGIGGIELGLHRCGHETSLLCEIDPHARAVLAAQFPDVGRYRDVQTLDALPPDVDLVTAGFPCQDLSQAGRTRGIKGARSGLVGEVFRLLESHRAPWLLIENVPFMLHLARGEALAVIIAALDALGYKWAYRVVDSRSFGVPQRRRRVYLVASTEGDPRRVLYADDAGKQAEPGKDRWHEAACGFYWTEGRRGLGWAHDAIPTLKGGSAVGIPSAPAIVLPRGEAGQRIGTPDIRDAERFQGFEEDWTEPAERNARASVRWKLLGNAVTVDAAAWIGGRLRKLGSYDGDADEAFDRSSSWPAAAYDIGSGPMVPADLSEWPAKIKRPALVDYLRYPIRPLSARASRGFYERLAASTLAKPNGFLDTLQAHLEVMEAAG